MAFLTNKTVLITGGCGTVGLELVDQILLQQPKEVRVVDCNESEVFFLEQRITETIGQLRLKHTQGNCYVGDIRDPDKMNMLCEGVDVLFHVAGLKHVILCERSPFDAVQTNVIGVKNVINSALANNVERVIFTSSDKAVNPTNVMGTSKLMGERLITAANSLKINRRTIFTSTRFGNVLGSRGSVVPIFYRQIRGGGPVTLTNREMTRFVMTLADSCRLVLAAAELARGGEVFVTKMPIMRIEDLAHVMISMLAEKFGHNPQEIVVDEIGAKAGEKLYEELMSDEETGRTCELPEMFAVLPAFRSVYSDIDYGYEGVLRATVDEPYVSSRHPAMSRDEIRDYLEQHRILELDESEFATGKPAQQIKIAA
ncbi:MAG: polysaccharide biosynthesis protein [Pirellulaceae bacterium]|nr:polysaccharide biosynthesis protein [Pirellulaceae bacterium]